MSCRPLLMSCRPLLSPHAPAGAAASVTVSKPAARTGPAAEAGLPGWMWRRRRRPCRHGRTRRRSGTDGGYVECARAGAYAAETVHDSRGLFVLGPMLTQNLARDFLASPGKSLLGFAKTKTSIKSMPMTFMSRFTTRDSGTSWQGAFSPGVSSVGALASTCTPWGDGGALRPEFSPNESGFFSHLYEVNTIFMRDGGGVPSPRAAFHLYPTSSSGIELVGSYGRLDSGANTLGLRLRRFKANVRSSSGLEYESWSAPQALTGMRQVRRREKIRRGR